MKQAISNSVDEASSLSLDPDEKIKLDEQDSIILNSSLTSPKTKIEVLIKSYVDSLPENSKTRRFLSSIFKDQDILNSNTVNKNPSSDEESANKIFGDDSISGANILGFIQTLENNLKVSAGNEINKHAKYDKIQFTDTTIRESANIGGNVLPHWKLTCNDKKNKGKISNFTKSTETNSSTDDFSCRR